MSESDNLSIVFTGSFETILPIKSVLLFWDIHFGIISLDPIYNNMSDVKVSPLDPLSVYEKVLEDTGKSTTLVTIGVVFKDVLYIEYTLIYLKFVSSPEKFIWNELLITSSGFPPLVAGEIYNNCDV